MFNQSSNSLSVLFVCTGNICRSALGERLLARKLSSLNTALSLSSAGTHALLGGAVPQEIIDFAASKNTNFAGHNPQDLTAAKIDSADLILTAERSHRSEVVSLSPRASAKTFTIKQFARLCDEFDSYVQSGEISLAEPISPADLISEIADFRSIASPIDEAASDDVADPYRRSQEAYDLANNQIDKATEEISQFLLKHI